MSTSMIPTDLVLPISKFTEEEKSWGDLITSATFLPRVQLFGGNSEAAKQGRIGVGRFGLVRSKDQLEDLTTQFDCLPLSWRFKAMRITEEAVLTYHNPKCDEFLTIVKEAEQPDTSSSYGIEFLIYLPSVDEFATYYLNSKTARRQAPVLKGLLKDGLAATLKSEFIKKGKYSWHGPVAVRCSTPFQLPPNDEIMGHAERFANPKDSEVEAVVDAVPEARPQ